MSTVESVHLYPPMYHNQCNNNAQRESATLANRSSIRASYGLFAKKLIEKDTKIGEYVGVRESDGLKNKSCYKLSLNEKTDIDAKKAGNETRFINDPRGSNSKLPFFFSS